MLYEIAQTCSSGCSPKIDMLPILIVVALLVGYSYWGERITKLVKEKVGMKNIKNIGIIAAVVVAAAAIVLVKQSKKSGPAKADAPVVVAAENAAVVAGDNAVGVAVAQEKAMPKLIDLGASKCIPCKAMKPILDDLKVNYADTFKTEFIDVWEDGEAGKTYGINLIPTQIFFGADGKELFRHEGFYGKEDILAKWKELGVEKAQ